MKNPVNGHMINFEDIFQNSVWQIVVKFEYGDGYLTGQIDRAFSTQSAFSFCDEA